MKRVLVLGAGLVSRPLVHYLTDQPDFEVTLASRTVSKAGALVEGRERGTAVALDVTDEAALEKLIAEHDLAVSLLPATEHVKVARLCLKRALLFWGPDEISNNKAIRFEKSSSRVLGPSPGFALPFALALAGAFVLAAEGRTAEAEEVLRASLETLAEVRGEEDLRTRAARRRLAAVDEIPEK